MTKPASIEQVTKSPRSPKAASFPDFPEKKQSLPDTGSGPLLAGEENVSPKKATHPTRPPVITTASTAASPSITPPSTSPTPSSRSHPMNRSRSKNKLPQVAASHSHGVMGTPRTHSPTPSTGVAPGRSISPYALRGTSATFSTSVEKLPQEPRKPQPLFVRLHGLNIIFNLCIHANIISPISMETCSNPMEQTHAMLNHLRRVLSRVITAACYYREANSRVLEWMLKCFLALNTVNGVVMKNVLVSMTDSRFVPLCLDHINTNNMALSQTLSLLLVNYVIPSSKTLSQAALLRIGGWRYIAQKYIESHSLKARDNYFVILYDLVFSNLLQENIVTKQDQDQSHFLLRLLRSVDFSQHATVLFKWIPKDVVQDTTQFLSRQHSRLLRTSQPMVPATFDTKIAAHLINSFVSLGRSYQHLAPNFHQLYKEIMKDRTGFDEKAEKLYKCIAVGTDLDLHNSSSVLFAMRYHKYDSSPTKAEHILRSVPKFCSRLASSDIPRVRDTLIRTTDRLILALSYRLLDTWDEALAREICEIFNTDCQDVLAATKGSQGVLGLVDLLFSLLVNNAWDSLQSPQLRENLGDRDSIFRLVVLGKCAVNSRLLSYVRIDMLCKLFQRLSSKRDGDMKTAVLVLIIRKCSTNSKDFNAVGLDYFRNMVESRHPEVALLASSFLLHQIQVQHPEQHKAIINQMLSVAKETENFTLMENQYLQIRAISPKETT
uniref:Uncharacterized protein n=1 Tax=Paramoeba aestuarina TaxID=180227 RepID=A0A7S4P1C3_9EUKA